LWRNKSSTPQFFDRRRGVGGLIRTFMLIREGNKLLLRISPHVPVTTNQLETFVKHVKKTTRQFVKTEKQGDMIILSMHELSSDYINDFDKITNNINLDRLDKCLE
jgi:hypothetical protein